jgi:spore germination protein GerM
VTRTRRLAPLIATVVVALTLCACGVPTSGARAIAKSQVPSAPPPVPTTTQPPRDFTQLTIVLLNAANNVAHPVIRYTPQESDRLSTVLSDLLAGPSPGETLDGLTTAIPETTRLIGVSPNPLAPAIVPSGPVTVNLSADFLDITGLDQVLAVEQVVFTIGCVLTPTTRVVFEVQGVPQDVPIGTGQAVSRAVDSSDYGTLSCAVTSVG